MSPLWDLNKLFQDLDYTNVFTWVFNVPRVIFVKNNHCKQYRIKAMKTIMWLFWTQDILKHRNKQLLCDVGRIEGKLILNKNQKSSNPWTAV